MSFDTLEKSTFSGDPVNLYEFQRTSAGTDYFWRYNSSDRDLVYGGATFTQSPIAYDTIRLSNEAPATELTVTLPITEEFCQAFRLEGAVPSDTVFLRIRRAHAGDITDIDTDLPSVNAAQIIWVGTVNGITQTDEIAAKITCQMLAASFRRGGLRYGYIRNCPHVLYAPNTCKVNRDDFRVDGSVVSQAGTTVAVDTFDSQPSGWFDGGFVEYALPSGIIERRMILSHVGNTIVLLGFTGTFDFGTPISGFAGCDRTVVVCRDKFNNLDNMGGFPQQPGRNPFDGQPVF